MNNETINLSDTSEAELTERLNAIKTAAVGENLTGVDVMIEQILAQSKLMRVKTGNYLKDNRNLIGGGIGITLAVGLELLSPTGSKKSAIMAGVAGGALLAATAPVLKAAPQSAMIASGAAIMTGYVGMCGGRITADYFPGNLGNGE